MAGNQVLLMHSRTVLSGDGNHLQKDPYNLRPSNAMTPHYAIAIGDTYKVVLLRKKLWLRTSYH